MSYTSEYDWARDAARMLSRLGYSVREESSAVIHQFRFRLSECPDVLGPTALARERALIGAMVKVFRSLNHVMADRCPVFFTSL